MSRELGTPIQPKLANISAVLVLAPDSEARALAAGSRQLLANRALEFLELIFEDVLVVGETAILDRRPQRSLPLEGDSAGSLRAIAAAFEAVREERVLLLSGNLAGVTLDLLLALTAWPEHDLVAPRSDGQIWASCGLYRRRELLERTRDLPQGSDATLDSLVPVLDCGFVEGEDLAALISDEN